MTSPLHARPAASRTRVTVPAWAWALVLLAVFGLYLVAQDNGAVLASLSDTAHEFFHDARHGLGVPCH